MKNRIAIILTFVLLVGALSGCAGTPVVYYSECDCPESTHESGNSSSDETTTVPTDDAVKTGLAVVTSIAKSEHASHADYDVTLVAVTVNDEGVIANCIIDSLGVEITFDAEGNITSDLDAQILTKNELGDSYGMKAYGNAKYEWYEQAAALADYAKGKTVEELKNGAIDESGRAPEGSDLASTATIYLGNYVSAIEEAVHNARHLGAQTGDELRLASISSIEGSQSATDKETGLAQLDCDVTALTARDGVITSCQIDSLQAKVNFDASGTITTDLAAPILTKNQLGENYGMVAWGNAKYEWYEQAASFAAYVTGKTAEEVTGIAVFEGKPADADLASSVTISIAGFQALIAKALW